MPRAKNSPAGHRDTTRVRLPRGWDLVPLAFAVGVVALHPLAEDVYHAMVAEDGPVEWATAVVYTVLTVVALVLSFRFLRGGLTLAAVAYLLLAAGMFFVAGEEVSWGQRVFGFDGPEALVERNLQSEANLHNLLDRYALHALYIFVGLWGLGLGRLVVRHVRPLRPTYLYAPAATTFWWFVPVTAYYLWVDYLGPAVQAVAGSWFEPLALGPARYQEAAELILAMAFAAFLLDVWRRWSNDFPPASPPRRTRGASSPVEQRIPNTR